MVARGFTEMSEVLTFGVELARPGRLQWRNAKIPSLIFFSFPPRDSRPENCKRVVTDTESRVMQTFPTDSQKLFKVAQYMGCGPRYPIQFLDVHGAPAGRPRDIRDVTC